MTFAVVIGQLNSIGKNSSAIGILIPFAIIVARVIEVSNIELIFVVVVVVVRQRLCVSIRLRTP